MRALMAVQKLQRRKKLRAKRLDRVELVRFVSDALHVVVSRHSVNRKNEADMSVKNKLLAELDDRVKPGNVFARQAFENRDFYFRSSSISRIHESGRGG